jgi:hypothetical protein
MEGRVRMEVAIVQQKQVGIGAKMLAFVMVLVARILHSVWMALAYPVGLECTTLIRCLGMETTPEMAI